MEDLSEFLRETDCIDFSNPLIVQKADELKAASSDEVDYIERAYRFVRDEIPHSWDASDGYIIHALNTVYIDSLQKWIRLDARGNKAGVNAQFSLEKEILAFPARPEFGEKDYCDNHTDLDARLKEILNTSGNILEVRAEW